MIEDEKPKAEETITSKVEDEVSQVFTKSEPEEVTAPAPAAPKVETTPAPTPAAPKRKPSVEVASSIPEVSISVSALVYREHRRNSVSVGVLQDRLVELGHADARADMRGWYHDGTRKAVEEWQRANGVEASGVCDSKTVERLFAGTPAKVVA